MCFSDLPVPPLATSRIVAPWLGAYLAIVVLVIAATTATVAFAADGPSSGPREFPVQTAGGFQTQSQPNSSGVVPATHAEIQSPRSTAASLEQPPTLTPPHAGTLAEKSTSGPRTMGALVTVAVSLAVVLGLFWLCAWLMRRGLPTSARRLPEEVVAVLGRAPLAGRQQMHVLRFGNKLLLVCASPSGVDTLGEITDLEEIDRLAGLCEQTQAQSATTAFKQIFGQLANDRSPKNPAVRKSASRQEAVDV